MNGMKIFILNTNDQVTIKSFTNYQEFDKTLKFLIVFFLDNGNALICCTSTKN